MPKVKKSTKKDPPEKVLADLAKKYPQLLNLTAPQRDDKLKQGEERSVAEKGADVLRALSQPLNYMREVGEGNYVPTQAELESKGISPMEQVGALANPMDHIYAALAEADVIDDPNYAKEDGVSYGSPALLSLITGSAPQRVSKGLDKSIKVLKEAGIKFAKKAAVPGAGQLKKSGYKGPKINIGPRTQSPNELFAPSVLEPYSQPTDIMNPDRVAGEGSEFVRRYFADPQVQDHYRGLLVGSNPSQAQMQDAVNVMYEDAASIQKKQSLLQSPERQSPERMRVEEIAEKEFGGDYARMFRESDEAIGLQRKHIQGLNETPENKVYQAALHPDFDSKRWLDTQINDDDAVSLEALFLRGQRSPDPSISPGDEYISPSASGQYLPANEVVLLKNKARGNKSTGTHETQHFSDVMFLHEASKPGAVNPNPARKILDGLSESVAPAFKNQVINNENVLPKDNFAKYLANPVEITARTREAQRYIANTLLNNPAKNPSIEALSQKERVSFLLGDFSVLDESSTMNVFKASFDEMAKENRAGVIQFFNEVIDGGKVFNQATLEPSRTTINMSDKKKKSISNLFKYALATTGAGAAYGSMDSGQQPPQGMAMGGKFKVKKKAQEGMRVKKSNGDPPKGYKRDADGYLTPVDFNEFHEMPSDSLNVDAIKKGISMAESIGGVLMMNPTSTATGMYGQRYSEIKDLPFMKGISREEFAKDLPLQEKVFEMRMDEGIGGPSIRRNVMELTEEYAPQLGDDWNFSPDDVAFLSNFIGRQGTRKYFASLRDGTKFIVPGTNKTVDEYLKIARGAAYKD